MRHDAYTCPPPTHAYIRACINVQVFTKAYIFQSDWQLFSDCVAWCSSVLQCVAVVVQCVAVSPDKCAGPTHTYIRKCSSVAVRCSVVQCVAVCGSVLQCVAAHKPIRPSTIFRVCCGVVLCVAMCCNVLQFVRVFAVFPFVLHRVVLYCSTPTYLTFV